jgi:hypothetical protein
MTLIQIKNVTFHAYDRTSATILDLMDDKNTFLVGANTVGDVQQGFMTQIAKKYPEMMRRFVHMCIRGKVELGRVKVLRPNPNPDNIQFFFCPLRTVSNDPPSFLALTQCLEDVVSIAARYHVNGIASHKLGCGSNPDFYLSWANVGNAMAHFLTQLDVPVSVIIGTKDGIPELAKVEQPVVVEPVVVIEEPTVATTVVLTQEQVIIKQLLYERACARAKFEEVYSVYLADIAMKQAAKAKKRQDKANRAYRHLCCVAVYGPDYESNLQTLENLDIVEIVDNLMNANIPYELIAGLVAQTA